MYNGFGHSSGWRNWIGTRVFKVLKPLCFDQSLSYYEQIAHFAHRLNELICAVNSQNVTIQDFIKAVTAEIDSFETRINERQDNFEQDINIKFDDYKALIDAVIEDFKSEMRGEWTEYRAEIEEWRSEIETEWEMYKTDLTAKWDQFVIDWAATWQTYKEGMDARFNTFTADVNTQLDEFRQDQTDFEQNLLIMLTNWMTETTASIIAQVKIELTPYFTSYINTLIHPLELKVSDITRALTLEINSRKSGDDYLQEQIDQLTPEGAIKADYPDSDNNSQLYTIDKTTGDRTNIYPVINGETGNKGTVIAELESNTRYIDLTSVFKSAPCNIFVKTGGGSPVKSIYHTLNDFIANTDLTQNISAYIAFDAIQTNAGAVWGIKGIRNASQANTSVSGGLYIAQTDTMIEEFPGVLPPNPFVNMSYSIAIGQTAIDITQPVLIDITKPTFWNVFTLIQWFDTLSVGAFVTATKAKLFDTKNNCYIYTDNDGGGSETDVDGITIDYNHVNALYVKTEGICDNSTVTTDANGKLKTLGINSQSYLYETTSQSFSVNQGDKVNVSVNAILPNGVDAQHVVPYIDIIASSGGESNALAQAGWSYCIYTQSYGTNQLQYFIDIRGDNAVTASIQNAIVSVRFIIFMQ